MSLQTRRPPGHAKRKALIFAADIMSLRGQGHSFSAIREALEDAGIRVSISTVRREAMREPPAAVLKPVAAPPRPFVDQGSRGVAGSPVPATAPAREIKPVVARLSTMSVARDRVTKRFISEPREW